MMILMIILNIALCFLYFFAPAYVTAIFGGIIWGGFSFIYEKKVWIYVTRKCIQDKTASWLLIFMVMTACYITCYFGVGKKCCIFVPLASFLYQGYKIHKEESTAKDMACLLLFGFIFLILLVI